MQNIDGDVWSYQVIRENETTKPRSFTNRYRSAAQGYLIYIGSVMIRNITFWARAMLRCDDRTVSTRSLREGRDQKQDANDAHFDSR